MATIFLLLIPQIPIHYLVTGDGDARSNMKKMHKSIPATPYLKYFQVHPPYHSFSARYMPIVTHRRISGKYLCFLLFLQFFQREDGRNVGVNVRCACSFLCAKAGKFFGIYG
jgi:hypothetical protein